jgi:hypothetical protein
LLAEGAACTPVEGAAVLPLLGGLLPEGAGTTGVLVVPVCA